MKIELTQTACNPSELRERIDLVDDGGTVLSTTGIRTLQSRFCGKSISTLAIGGVATPPQYRRHGYVRMIFDHVLSMSAERDWAVAMLHPFDAAYYNKFGFEKISDHKILTFPITKLGFLPRCSNLVPLDSEKRLTDVLTVYEKFAAKRNGLFHRYDSKFYTVSPSDEQATYIWYDETGEAASYITLSVEEYFEVNRMVSVALHVKEFAFTTPASLHAILGFLRMYEGTCETVKIHHCGMAPEIDAILRYYTDTSYQLVADVQARILDMRSILAANEYPMHSGSFRIFVEDTLPKTRGLWEVQYANGTGSVEKLSDQPESYDIYAPIDALTKLIYGYEAYSLHQLPFIKGVKVRGDCADFLAAFPKRHTGFFEHF